MNNKGFAITTILYGIMVLFCILLVSMLGILSSYRKTQELLTESTNGSRDIVKYDTFHQVDIDNINSSRIIYCDEEKNVTYCCYRSVILPDGGYYSYPVIEGCKP